MNILDIKEKQWWKELFLSISLSWNIPIFGVSIGSNNKKNSNDFSQDIKNHNKQKAIIDIMNKEFIKEANTKYVVVLDELDRCSPNKIIEILSLINFILLKIKAVYFIVCTNNEVINQLESNFYNTNELNEEKYIDKIFHQKLDLELISDIKKLPLEIENNELICIFLNETKISNFRLIKNVAKHVDNFIKNQELKNSIFQFLKGPMHPAFIPDLNKLINYFSKIVYFLIFIFFYWKIYKKEIFIDFFNRKKDLKVNNPMHLKKFIEQNNIELKTPIPQEKFEQNQEIFDSSLGINVLIRVKNKNDQSLGFVSWEIWELLTTSKDKIIFDSYSHLLDFPFKLLMVGIKPYYHCFDLNIENLYKFLNIRKNEKYIMLKVLLNFDGCQSLCLMWPFFEENKILERILIHN